MRRIGELGLLLLGMADSVSVVVSLLVSMRLMNGMSASQ